MSALTLSEQVPTVFTFEEGLPKKQMPLVMQRISRRGYDNLKDRDVSRSE